MTCETALRLIDSFVGDELAPEDARALADHLRGCASCTAEMASASRLVELLATLPDVPPTPDFDERVLLAAIEDRRHRHEHRNRLADLWAQMMRGAMRTTGTLVLTMVAAAFLIVAFVAAASNLVPGFAQQVGLVPPPAPTHHVSHAPPTPSPTPVTARAHAEGHPRTGRHRGHPDARAHPGPDARAHPIAHAHPIADSVANADGGRADLDTHPSGHADAHRGADARTHLHAAHAATGELRRRPPPHCRDAGRAGRALWLGPSGKASLLTPTGVVSRERSDIRDPGTRAAARHQSIDS